MSSNDVDIRVRLRDARRFVADANNASGSLLGVGKSAKRAERDAGSLSRVTGGLGMGLGAVAKQGAFAATAGAGIAVAFGIGAVKAFSESRKVGAQTEAVLRSTGHAANVTSSQVGDLATHLSNVTGVDDEVVQSGANMLLTFTNVRNAVGKGNHVFDQATKAAVDMSAALGTKPTEAAMMLGKALNDPAKGLTRLAKSGVTFTKQQTSQVKAMVKAGDTLGAQKIILGEVGREFGGSAAAQGDALDKLQVTAGNLQEAIGGALFPAVSRAADGLRKFIDGVTQGTGAGGKFRAILGGLVDRVKALVPVVLALARDGLAKAREGFAGFLAAVKPAQPFFANVLLPLLKGIAVGIIGGVVGAVRVAVPVFRLLMIALGAVGKFLAPLKPFFYAAGVAIGFVAAGPVMKMIAGAGKLGRAFGFVGDAVRVAVGFIRNAVGVYARLFGAATKVGGYLGGGLVRALSALGGPFRAVATVASGAFRTILTNGGKLLAFFRGLGSKIASGVKGAFSPLSRAFASAYNVIASAWNRLELSLNIPDALPGLPGSVKIGTPDIPLLAKGGNVTAAGAAIVGDAGPELLRLPRGARVDPLAPAPGLAAAAAGGGTTRVVTQVYLDRRQIAEAVGDYARERLERA